jgi:hypothetical protein
MPEASKGVLYSSLTNHSPLSTIFCFGEELPSQFFDGPQSLHHETVEIIFDSISSLFVLSFTSNTQNEKLP